MAKGAGMIRPDMATMLAFLATDAAVPRDLLLQLLQEAVADTFNAISIDGDTSTNDACVLCAAGTLAGESISASSDDAAARSASSPPPSVREPSEAPKALLPKGPVRSRPLAGGRATPASPSCVSLRCSPARSLIGMPWSICGSGICTPRSWRSSCTTRKASACKAP